MKDMKQEIGREGHDIVRGALEFKQEEPYSPERRKFLVLVILGCGGIISAIVGLPLLGVFLQPLLQTPKDVWRVVGKVDDFAISTTTQVVFQNAYDHAWDGVSTHDSAWLRRVSSTTFTAFSEYCQHLGCPVRWNSDAQLFFCPCHGGAYYSNGQVAAGPPPRALQQYQTRIRDGYVELKTGAIPFAY